MIDQDNQLAVAELRRRAEELARGEAARTPENLEALSPEATRRLLHELEVHQIELEMQNQELRRAQAELEVARARYFDLYDQAPVGYVTLSAQGLILEANLTATILLGMARSALVRQFLSQFIFKEDQDLYYLHRKQLFETGAAQTCELRMARPDGSPFWARLEATAAQDAAGTSIGRAVLIDLTAHKQAEDELHHAQAALEIAHRELQQSLAREQRLARTDGLTGLCNRRYFLELAAREFNTAVRYRHPLALLMFDVDGFKRVNDTLGHRAGDEVLAWVAQTATAQIRAVDVLARYGGDEFVILLPQTSAQQALPMAERLRERVAARRLETPAAGVTLSIGIAELGSEPGEASIERVVQRADQALYLAKANGRNCTVTYSAETQGSEP